VGAVSAAAVEVRGLSKRFGGVHAVEDVTMTVDAGEVRGVIGPNGAGKTTLLNIMSGLMRPSAGRIAFFGEDAVGWKPNRIARRARVVRTFQTVRVFATMTVFENVLVAAGTRHPEPGEFLLGVDDPTAMGLTERVDAVLEALGIAHLRDSNVTELAYGTRRKIELARALVMHPRLLLLDEPAAGLNGAERAELGDLLRRLRAHGLTVVLVEHQMDLVSSVCDTLTVLDFGKVICEGRPKEVVEDRNVLEAYLGVPEEVA
jgi:branched-chain amino acid transport system ATP-binding protein